MVTPKTKKTSLYIRVGLCLLLVVFVLKNPQKALAVACTGLPAIGNTTLTNCVLTVATSTATGADQANNLELSTANSAVLTLGSGANVTINSGGTLAAGSISLTGGTIAIDNGGTTSPKTPLYAPDADADGWADSLTATTSTASGKRRFSLMQSFTTVDCSSSAYSTTNTCLTANGGACAADNTCLSGICGTNSDGDSYFSQAAGHSGTCQASSLPYTDCYDSNANAYPSSTYCSSTNRGDGSYDYNCSTGTETTCGTIQDYSCSSTLLTNDYCSGTTCAANTVTGYLASTAACGAVGCTCSTSLTRGTSCSAVGGPYPSCSLPTTASYCSAVASASQGCQ